MGGKSNDTPPPVQQKPSTTMQQMVAEQANQNYKRSEPYVAPEPKKIEEPIPTTPDVRRPFAPPTDNLNGLGTEMVSGLQPGSGQITDVPGTANYKGSSSGAGSKLNTTGLSV